MSLQTGGGGVLSPEHLSLVGERRSRVLGSCSPESGGGWGGPAGSVVGMGVGNGTQVPGHKGRKNVLGR